MKNIIATLLLWMEASTVIAQCGMTVSASSNIHCMSGFVQINTTGGTPPYTIVVVKLPQNTVMGQYSDADGDDTFWSNGYGWDVTGGARVTVVDATNCTATMDAMHNSFTWSEPLVLPTVLDCATGGFKLNLHWSVYGAPWTYQLNNGPVLNVVGNWTSNGTSNVLNAQLSSGAHTITFPEYGSSFTVCGSSISVTVPTPLSPGDCNVNLRVQAALEGALPSGTIMNDGLRQAGLIPLLEPYSALGYVYTGTTPGVSVAPALLSVTGNNAVVDWVLIELRSSTAPYPVVFSKPALLQRDGDVIDTDGDDYLSTPLANGAYRVAVRHRNHLTAMTIQSYQMGSEPLTINFRSIATYGTNAQVTKGGVNCLWAADATADGVIKYSGTNNDRDQVLLAIGGVVLTNTLANVYDRRDLNMDGVVKYTGAGNDRDVILQNIGGTVPSATRTQQLP